MLGTQKVAHGAWMVLLNRQDAKNDTTNTALGSGDRGQGTGESQGCVEKDAQVHIWHISFVVF
jgi:hypothetical protein